MTKRIDLPKPSAQSTEKEPLQVRIPVSLKRRFKSHAALRGLEPHELFVEMWEVYERTLELKPADTTKRQAVHGG